MLLFLLTGCSEAPELSGHAVQLGEERHCEGAASESGAFNYQESASERGLLRTARTESAGQEEALLGVGVAVEDLDGDGDLDLAVSNRPDGLQIFENSGEGRFADVSPIFSDADRLTLQSTTGFFLEDFDHDGLLDLVLFGPRGIWVSRNQGSFNFGSLASVYTEVQSDPGVPLSAVQFDGDTDGDLDLVLLGLDPVSVLDSDGVGTQGSSERYLERRGERYVLAETLKPESGEGISMVGLASDRDGDGDLDLLAPSLRGSFGMAPTAFYTNPSADESGEWRDSAGPLSADLAVSGMGVDSADLNQDGAWDYCISDLNRLQCLLSQKDGSFSEGAQALGLALQGLESDQGWSGWSLELADLDNDGQEDLAVVAGSPLTVVGDERNYEGASNLLWRREGAGFVSVDGGDFLSTVEHYGLVAADLDEDGRLELLSTGLSDELQLHRLPCSQAGWTSVRLAGPRENLRGLGATVEVETEGGVQRQALDGIRGLAQGPARAHFGLGDSALIERLTVRWPDGTVTETRSVPVNRSVVVPHPSRFVGGGDTSDPVDTQDDTGSEAETASMNGVISRSAEPSGDGLGELIVMLFEGNPMDSSTTPPIAWWSSEADFSDPAAQVAYQLDAIPVREEPYSVVVFLDDDRSGPTTGPNSGDLVAMESMMSFPQVTLSEAQAYEASFVLNIGVP